MVNGCTYTWSMLFSHACYQRYSTSQEIYIQYMLCLACGFINNQFYLHPSWLLHWQRGNNTIILRQSYDRSDWFVGNEAISCLPRCQRNNQDNSFTGNEAIFRLPWCQRNNQDHGFTGNKAILRLLRCQWNNQDNSFNGNEVILLMPRCQRSNQDDCLYASEATQEKMD